MKLKIENEEYEQKNEVDSNGRMKGMKNEKENLFTMMMGNAKVKTNTYTAKRVKEKKLKEKKEKESKKELCKKANLSPPTKGMKNIRSKSTLKVKNSMDKNLKISKSECKMKGKTQDIRILLKTNDKDKDKLKESEGDRLESGAECKD